MKKTRSFFHTAKKTRSFFHTAKKTRSFFHTAKKTKVFFIDHFWFFFEFCPDHLDSPRNAIFFSFADSNFCCAFFSSCKKQLKNVLYYETKIYFIHPVQQIKFHSRTEYYLTLHPLEENWRCNQLSYQHVVLQFKYELLKYWPLIIKNHQWLN